METKEQFIACGHPNSTGKSYRSYVEEQDRLWEEAAYHFRYAERLKKVLNRYIN